MTGDDVRSLLEAYNAQLRAHVHDRLPDSVRMERDGPLLRTVGFGNRGWVEYRDLAGLDGEELDGLIARHAQGWSLERIAPLERNIMRVALYEALHREDIPVEVAIDEAVELSKEYCGAEAPGFVNGILGAAVGNPA